MAEAIRLQKVAGKSSDDEEGTSDLDSANEESNHSADHETGDLIRNSQIDNHKTTSIKRLDSDEEAVKTLRKRLGNRGLSTYGNESRPSTTSRKS